MRETGIFYVPGIRQVKLWVMILDGLVSWALINPTSLGLNDLGLQSKRDTKQKQGSTESDG